MAVRESATVSECRVGTRAELVVFGGDSSTRRKRYGRRAFEAFLCVEPLRRYWDFRNGAQSGADWSAF
jgi:hypothetical protein